MAPLAKEGVATPIAVSGGQRCAVLLLAPKDGSILAKAKGRWRGHVWGTRRQPRQPNGFSSLVGTESSGFADRSEQVHLV